MANPEHLAILKQGVKAWNKWREDALDVESPDLSGIKLIKADLKGANLVGTDLTQADLTEANFLSSDLAEADLSGANLKQARLNGADLSLADMSRTDLSTANLSFASLFRTDLREANLKGASLHWTNLQEAFLAGASFADAQLGETIFGNVDLSLAIGLDHVEHTMPSSVGIDTIFKSQGKIPESFLRGCGVPEDFIRYLPSFFSQPFQFYSCFISHSTKDAPFCQRLHADLQASKVRTWYFPEDAKWGNGVWAEIDRGIHLYDKLVVVCSENSLNSRPVLREIERALNREDKEGKEVLFPIRLDGHVFEEWEHPRKADLTAKVIGDFSHWKDHDAYQRAFDRLLAALQAQG